MSIVYVLCNMLGIVKIPKWEVRTLALNKTLLKKKKKTAFNKHKKWNENQIKWLKFWLK